MKVYWMRPRKAVVAGSTGPNYWMNTRGAMRLLYGVEQRSVT